VVKVFYAKELIIKSLFQNKTFSLQSSKVGTFWEMRKKSCFLEKFYAKIFHFNVFCPYFCPLKCCKNESKLHCASNQNKFI